MIKDLIEDFIESARNETDKDFDELIMEKIDDEVNCINSDDLIKTLENEGLLMDWNNLEIEGCVTSLRDVYYWALENEFKNLYYKY